MKARQVLAAALMAALPVLATSAAGAEDFLTRLLGRAPGKGVSYACFTRAYDGAHLASHPQQNVRSMVLLVVVDSDSPGSYKLRIGAHFRSSKKGILETEGDCGVSSAESDAASPAGAHCSVACDGGSLDVALRDKNAVLLTVPDGARMWTPGADDTSSDAHGAFGPDDKLFRLDRSSTSECAEQGEDATEKAKLKRMN